MTDAVTAALEAYEFGEAGRLMYEFFWFDFADWYIEIAKSRLYSDDADRKRCAQTVLAYVLEASTRLWHPFIPYVTERLWRAIPHQGDALMSAAWPDSGLPCCTAARTQFDILKQIVSAVRNARSEYNVEISKKVSAVFCIEDALLRDTLTQELDSVCLLAKIDSTSVSVRSFLLRPRSAAVVVCGGCCCRSTYIINTHICRSFHMYQTLRRARALLSLWCKRGSRLCCL